MNIYSRFDPHEMLFDRAKNFFALVAFFFFLLWTVTAQANGKIVLALGNSLTAGYGLH